MTPDFIHEVTERGFIHQCTDLEGLKNLLKQKQITAYLGFDPTADSLHVGHLMGIMFLRLLQQCGHRPIVLMGGGTAKVGDPTGKDEMRQFLTDEVLDKNIKGIIPTFEKFIRFGDNDAILVNNDDWLKKLNYIEFLRDIGKHFSVNRMLSFDSAKIRLEREQNLSFIEFNYMIMQGYDFLELYKNYGCEVQLGGSDQWGNIVNGVDLVRKVLGKQVYGLTAPLITTSSGAKMGKTSSGAVWLNPNRLPAFDYWQFWRNTADAEVIRYLKFFTNLPLDKIQRLSKLKGAEINEAKKILADECTSFIHGKESLPLIHDSIAQLYEKSNQGSLAGLPECIIDFKEKMSVFDLCVATHLTASKGEARRLMEGGGLRINDEAITSEVFYESNAFPLKISVGKKRHVLVKVR
jgi:tyrosyl-tRNA synthetase